MTFSANQILTAAELNDFSTNSLGVGTTSPDADIEVETDTGTTPTSPTEIRISTSTSGGSWSTTAPWGQLSFWSADTSNGGAKVQAAVATTANESFGGLGRLGLWTHDGTSLQERLSVTNAGDVGIGTTSPSTDFHIQSPNNEAFILENNGTTSGRASMKILTNGDDWEMGGRGSAAGNAFYLYSLSASAYRWYVTTAGNTGINTNTPSATLDVNGSLSKNSGSFKIQHPLPAMAETHNLVHSFVEAPQADNIYRGRVALVDGAATVDLDEAAGMTTGTFELLNRDLQCFIVNNEGWTAVRGSMSGSTLTIEAQDATCADTVDWLVIGERHDQHMYDTEWTDDDGRVIVEPLRPAEPEPDPEPTENVETETTATEAL